MRFNVSNWPTMDTIIIYICFFFVSLNLIDFHIIYPPTHTYTLRKFSMFLFFFHFISFILIFFSGWMPNIPHIIIIIVVCNVLGHGKHTHTRNNQIYRAKVMKKTKKKHFLCVFNEDKKNLRMKKNKKILDTHTHFHNCVFHHHHATIT